MEVIFIILLQNYMWTEMYFNEIRVPGTQTRSAHNNMCPETFNFGVIAKHLSLPLDR
jgi:hypothetical protein